jgi:hypothetical protein
MYQMWQESLCQASTLFYMQLAHPTGQAKSNIQTGPRPSGHISQSKNFRPALHFFTCLHSLACVTLKPADLPLFPNQPKSKTAKQTSSKSGDERVFPNQPKSAKPAHRTTTAQAPIFSDPPMSETSRPAFSSPSQTSFKIPKPPSVPPFQMPSLASTGRGKLIAMLGILALVLGVLAELIAIGTGFHNMNKADSEARIKAVEALAAECNLLYPTPECQRRLDALGR